MTADPFGEFSAWFTEARKRETLEVDAVALASADADGRPSLRMVLMRAFDERGFVFYTNLGSRKCHDFTENPYAAMCFHWKSVARQVRIEGTVERVSADEADAYFASRPRESQIGAWASKQSQVLESRAVLEQRVMDFAGQFADKAIPRPEFWSGFRLVPQHFEFWDERPARLHDRFCYYRDGASWRIERVYP
ncbi:MAG: pyridoxamine 5'-phosphate oxidase [Gammaproteobacteria bacterium]|jgi:pyridoxamine 5'-phosphate oxidase